MGFSNGEYGEIRPTLWHLTHRDNLSHIQRAGTLLPAAAFTDGISSSPRRALLRASGIVLRDQSLVSRAAVEFNGGWDMAEFLRSLAERVFFWPGWTDRPIRRAAKAAARYRDTDVLLRMPFEDVAAQHEPYFTRCNSGATRMQKGKPVIRGPDTYSTAQKCAFRPADVAEVTFAGPVTLPASCEVATSPDGLWGPLFPRGA
jgi:hypothetical protein